MSEAPETETPSLARMIIAETPLIPGMHLDMTDLALMVFIEDREVTLSEISKDIGWSNRASSNAVFLACQRGYVERLVGRPHPRRVDAVGTFTTVRLTAKGMRCRMSRRGGA